MRCAHGMGRTHAHGAGTPAEEDGEMHLSRASLPFFLHRLLYFIHSIPSFKPTDVHSLALLHYHLILFVCLFVCMYLVVEFFYYSYLH